MARGGSSFAHLEQVLNNDIDTQLDAVAHGSSVAVFVGPDQSHLARAVASSAYQRGAGWVEIIYTTSADNAYSGDRAAKCDLAVHLDGYSPSSCPWDAHQRSVYAKALVHNAFRIQQGDKIIIDASADHAPVVESVVREAYLAGALTVDVHYTDARDNLMRAVSYSGDFPRAPEQWKKDRIDLAMADGACYLAIQDNDHAGLADEMHRQRQLQEQASRRYDTHDTYYAAQQQNKVRWCIAQAPTRAWAERVYPELDAEVALQRLGMDLLDFAYCGPEDTPDAYADHVRTLHERADWLNSQNVRELVFTDDDGRCLTVPLLEGARFLPCDWEAISGERFACNVPSAEIFTSPDSAKVSGSICTTRPVILSGRQVDQIELEFVDGKAQLVSCTPPEHAKVVQAYLRADAGASRLGEIGIVAQSRVGDRERLYFNDIIDENACSHIALGYGYDAAIDPQAENKGANNTSQIHVDLMVAGHGSRSRLEAVTDDGRRFAIVDGNIWQPGA